MDVTVLSSGPEGTQYEFGFTNLRKWVRMALECGVEYFEFSHLFSQWGAKAAPKIMADKDGIRQRIFGWETDASGREYREFLHQFLPALKRNWICLGLRIKHISIYPMNPIWIILTPTVRPGKPLPGN